MRVIAGVLAFAAVLTCRASDRVFAGLRSSHLQPLQLEGAAPRARLGSLAGSWSSSGAGHLLVRRRVHAASSDRIASSVDAPSASTAHISGLVPPDHLLVFHSPDLESVPSSASHAIRVVSELHGATHAATVHPHHKFNPGVVRTHAILHARATRTIDARFTAHLAPALLKATEALSAAEAALDTAVRSTVDRFCPSLRVSSMRAARNADVVGTTLAFAHRVPALSRRFRLQGSCGQAANQSTADAFDGALRAALGRVAEHPAVFVVEVRVAESVSPAPDHRGPRVAPFPRSGEERCASACA